jgi:arginase family enzyme
VKTNAIFFPFDLFGSPGARSGAELLADAFREMLKDNRREQMPTRARAYQKNVRMREFAFENLRAYQGWREQARRVVRPLLRRGDFLLWITGNHLGVLPLYDELARHRDETIVVQLDAHLDIYNLSDCTAELSHGNFLLHCDGCPPPILNLGHRDLFLPEEYIRKHYRHTFSAAELAIDPAAALARVHQECQSARRVFLDLDCDVFDPAYFPGVAQPLPFGLSSHLVLRLLDAAWSDRVMGLAISEFDPGRDRNDQSLATLVWLLEYVLLKRYAAER